MQPERQPNSETCSYFLLNLALGFTQGLYNFSERTTMTPKVLALIIAIVAYVKNGRNNPLRVPTQELAMAGGFSVGYFAGALFASHPTHENTQRQNPTFSLSNS